MMSLFTNFRPLVKLRLNCVFSDISTFRHIQTNCERYASTSVPKNILLDDNSIQEESDKFGSLRKPLEHKPSQKISKNVRVIRMKSRPSPKQTSDANVFGTLSDKNPVWYPDILEEAKVDNDQSDDSVMVKNISKVYRSKRLYLKRVKEYVAEKKLKMALDLFVEMKRNFVKPIHAHFTFMIGACGKAGYTEMAFKLLKQMTDRGMTPTPATLTGLFNSCGECPFPEVGLRKAQLLKEKIAVKNWVLTQITYHAMIKAFGKCGDIQTAFQIVDEMIKADIKIDAETFNFLLMSCITDKQSGFTHAVEVLRKMKAKKCVPNQFTYNLLLRAARDCDIGPEEISCLLLQHWSNYLSRPYGFKIKGSISEKPLLKIEGSGDVNNDFNLSDNKSTAPKIAKQEENDEVNASLVESKDFEKNLVTTSTPPSVLGTRPTGKADIIELGNIKTPNERLALIGGAAEFLNAMKKDNVKPNIKTFTLLLECLPPHTEAEKELISLLDTYKVIPDVGFCNVLMKRRTLRYDNAGAKEVLLLINEWGVTPDLLTYGILAMGCRRYNQALSYLADLKKIGVSLNTEIVGALLSCACFNFDLKYLRHILELMEEENIKPNEKILIKIDKTLDRARRNIIDLEHNKEVPSLFKKDEFPRLYKEFCKFYENWLHKMELDKEEHVWSQYKTEIVEKIEDKPCIIFKDLNE